jgi:hypothetical protein
VPAVLAALLVWPWWLGCALLIPGLAVYGRAERATAAARGIISRDGTAIWIGAIMSLPIGLTFPKLSNAYPEYVALMFVGYLMIFCDPLMRLVYRLRRPRADATTTPGAGTGDG